MLALNEQHAALLFAKMDDEEIRELSQSMANLGVVTANMVEQVFVDFASQVGTAGLRGSYESTERKLLDGGLEGDRVSQIMEELRSSAGRTLWDKLGNVNEATRAAYLRQEYPQTVAVVLSKLTPDNAAKVLTAFPEEFAMEVVTRMLSMEAVRKDVVDTVERTLRSEFMNTLSRTTRRDAHETMAEIFNYMDRATETRFIASLEDRSQEAADKIKALMFTFEDRLKIDAGGIQTLLRTVEKTQLGTALKGASDQLNDLFFSNMSERAGKILREDMDSMGPGRMRRSRRGADGDGRRRQGPRRQGARLSSPRPAPTTNSSTEPGAGDSRQAELDDRAISRAPRRLTTRYGTTQFAWRRERIAADLAGLPLGRFVEDRPAQIRAAEVRLA